MNSKLAEVLAGVFDLRVSEINSDLQKDDLGNWDSLKQMDLVLSVERAYDITLDIPDIVRMQSVASIVAVLSEKGCDVAD